MRKKIVLIILALTAVNVTFAAEKYFFKKRVSLYGGFRNVNLSQKPLGNNLDFLNYVYTDGQFDIYQYSEVELKLWSKENYQIETKISFYDNLTPYGFNVSFNYLLNSRVGVEAGSMASRLYLTEFNQFYSHVFDQEFYPRTIERQWNFSLGSVYIGPTFQMNYKWLQFETTLKAGVSSYLPFHQQNSIKKYQSNYKMVFDYQTNMNAAFFVMPEIEIFADIVKLNKILLGGRFKVNHYYSRNAVNYKLTTYEWTYENPVESKVRNTKHTFQQTDWDFGVFLRW